MFWYTLGGSPGSLKCIALLYWLHCISFGLLPRWWRDACISSNLSYDLSTAISQVLDAVHQDLYHHLLFGASVINLGFVNLLSKASESFIPLSMASVMKGYRYRFSHFGQVNVPMAPRSMQEVCTLIQLNPL